MTITYLFAFGIQELKNDYASIVNKQKQALHFEPYNDRRHKHQAV
jgi:hypothetical protein